MGSCNRVCRHLRHRRLAAALTGHLRAVPRGPGTAHAVAPMGCLRLAEGSQGVRAIGLRTLAPQELGRQDDHHHGVDTPTPAQRRRIRPLPAHNGSRPNWPNSRRPRKRGPRDPRRCWRALSPVGRGRAGHRAHGVRDAPTSRDNQQRSDPQTVDDYRRPIGSLRERLPVDFAHCGAAHPDRRLHRLRQGLDILGNRRRFRPSRPSRNPCTWSRSI